MKKVLIIVSLLSIFTGIISAQNSDAMQKLLQQAEDNTAFYNVDFNAQYKIVQEKPAEGLKQIDAIMHRRDSKEKWVILITGPEKDRGKGYLQFDSNIWFYDPKDRRYTFSSARDKFQDTNANNSDFMPQKYAQNFAIEKAEEAKLGPYECILFTLKAKVKNVDYPRLRLWVSKNDGLVRKREDYSLSNQKLRSIAIPSYQIATENGRTHYAPKNMVIQDNLKGKKLNGKMVYEKTTISIANINFEKQDDSVYTKPYLEMMSER